MSDPREILQRQLQLPPGPKAPPGGDCHLCKKPVVWIVDNMTRRTETCDAAPRVFMTTEGRKSIKGYEIHVCQPNVTP